MNYESYEQPIVDKKGKALASFILGLCSIVGWILPIIGVPVTITGFVLGIIGLKSSRKVMAIIGIVLCVIFFIASGVNAAWGAYNAIQALS